MEIVDPGVVPVAAWRPDPGIAVDPESAWYWVGIGRSPDPSAGRLTFEPRWFGNHVGWARTPSDKAVKMVNDVEKRWHDPRTFRRAATYVCSVLATAALVFALALLWAAERQNCSEADTLLCDTPAQVAMLIGPSSVLLIGGIGAFVETYVQWRRGRTWPIWQGAGWFLFILMVVYLGIGGGSLTA